MGKVYMCCCCLNGQLSFPGARVSRCVRIGAWVARCLRWSAVIGRFSCPSNWNNNSTIQGFWTSCLGSGWPCGSALHCFRIRSTLWYVTNNFKHLAYSELSATSRRTFFLIICLKKFGTVSLSLSLRLPTLLQCNYLSNFHRNTVTGHDQLLW